jgi:rare lipoprotein A
LFAGSLSAEAGEKFNQSGIASIYSHHGQKTANGERANVTGLTAAHKSLPFGTRVRVTNRKNGRSVVVRINDRGPFIKGRVIDVTPAGARLLGFAGLTQVSLDVVTE